MNTIDLKTLWMLACGRVPADGTTEWVHIEASYTAPSRHYHTLQHLCSVYADLHEYYVGKVPTATAFALFFHDIIYSPLRGDNEKRSADHAAGVLHLWQAAPELVSRVSDMIVATATHQSDDLETQVFLDADMAILGAPPEVYAAYIAAVRHEYTIYPDLIYHGGRRKFIAATLQRARIYLTDHFHRRYEAQARINLSHELNSLS